jgi:hypothetical protein
MLYDPAALRFDQLALKQGIALGVYPSREALEASVIPVQKTDDAWPAYETWCEKRGYALDGNILTTAYDADYLNRRAETLKEQIQRVNRGGFKIPECVVEAFSSVAKEKSPSESLNATVLTTGRWNLHFDLQTKFLGKKLTTTYAAATEEYAQRCNKIIRDSTNTEFAKELKFENVWSSVPSDILLVEFAALYEGETGLNNLAHKIAQTGAKRVALTNLYPNEENEGYWAAQPSDGGYIPVYIPGKGELAAIMNRAGYKQSHDPVVIAPDFPINPASGYKKQYPLIEHHIFELAA